MNKEVLRRINEGRSIIRAIRMKEGNWIGQILRRNCLQKLLIEGKIEGRRGRGRRRYDVLTDLMMERSCEQLKKAAQDVRVQFS